MSDLLVPVSVNVIGQIDRFQELECTVNLSTGDFGSLDYQHISIG